MDMNFYVPFLAALIPTAVGALWYSPVLFNNAWMKATGLTEDDLKGANMPVVFILAYVFSLLFAFGITGMVIHDFGVLGLAGGDLGTLDEATQMAVGAFLEAQSPQYRSFGHGALHGGIGAIVSALPILATNAMFERKGWKYILINVGYWFVTMTLMGGVICAFI
ncbi:MAG: DUF1761 domain-containing protein [Bacteroidota bacterium]